MQRRFLRKRGAAGQRARPLSQALSGLPALPKGEPLAKPVTLHLNRELSRHAKGSPFGGAGALAPERARKVEFAPAASHYDPSVKIAFGALRRARQTRNKIFFPLHMCSNDDDRRQRRKQGGVVGAAASKTRVPPKARCGCWVPQPGSSGAHFKSSRPRQGTAQNKKSRKPKLPGIFWR